MKIQVTLPDGSVRDAVAGFTTPMAIAESISKSLAKKIVVAAVKNCDTDAEEEWDVFRPLEKDCTMRLCTFSDPEGQETFWHS